ncbi:MAG: transmembrane 220 family protein [Hyphomicrobiales bacterium]
MRYVFAVLALLMLLFVAAQYNDPDGPLWMAFYGVPAIWAGIAAVRPGLLTGPVALALVGACVLAGLVLMVVLWPPAAEWWRTEVWWESEASREGMGLMLVAGVLLAVLARSLSLRSRTSANRH